MIRWLLALISDTGMRLSEAAGLSKDNVYLNEELPYVDIKPHPWRRLKTAGPDYVIHSFRHSMRDRLRAVGCPSDMIDQIGGWSSGKIGEGYGDGYSIEISARWLSQIKCS
jgi:integrase